MIKKTLLGLGVAFLSFIGFSNGLSIIPIGSSSTFAGGNDCIIYSNLGISCSESLSVLSSYSDYYNSITNIFWSNDGIGVYVSKSGGNYQGYINDYYICSGNVESLNNQSFLQNDCNPGFTKVSFSSYNTFLNYIKQYTPRYFWNMYNDGYYGISLSVLYDNFYFSYLIPSDILLPSYITQQNLGFYGYNFDTVNFSNSYVLNSPYAYPLDGGSININCPTVGQLIFYYDRNGFSSGLCYTSSKIYSGNSFVSVNPVSIFSLYSSKEDFLSSLSDYANYCENSVYDRSVCASAFEGKDLQFNLLSKIPNSLSVLGKRKQLYLYCGLYDYDVNTTTCVGSGVVAEIGEDYTRNDVLDEIINGSAVIVSPNQDGLFSGGNFSWSGDIISNIQNLFITFTGLFKKQTSNTVGFLPSYILGAFLLIILFKLFKK